MAPEVPGGCLAGLAGCGQARLTYANTRLVRRVWAPQRPELGSRPGEVPGSGGTRGGHGYGPRATGVEAFGTEIAEEPREGLSQLSGPRPGGALPSGTPSCLASLAAGGRISHSQAFVGVVPVLELW